MNKKMSNCGFGCLQHTENTHRHTLTLQRSCCSACRLRWSPLFYLCCPVERRREQHGHSHDVQISTLGHRDLYKDFSGLSQTVRRENFDCRVERHSQRDGKRERDTQVWNQIKKLPVVCFFHAGCSKLTDTFQRHSRLKFLMYAPPSRYTATTLSTN